MTDAWTVVWKETRAFFSNRGPILLGYGFLILAFGVWMPLDAVDAIARGHFARPLMIFILMGVILASSQTARSFAGEREAKTLASLLSTRIGDRSLFLGKTASIVLFSVAMLTVAGILHLAVINAVSRLQGGGWLFYQARLDLVPYMFVMPFLVVCLTSLVGVLISLRVRSVRGAYLLNLFSGAPWVAVAFAAIQVGPFFGSRQATLLSAAGLLGVLTVVLAWVVGGRFRRETLVLGF